MHVVERQGQKFGMGRVPSLYDARNDNFRMAMATPKRTPKTQIWTPGPVLNQVETPSCVGHGGRGWELCEPVPNPVQPDELAQPDPQAVTIWQQSQIKAFGRIDPEDGATIHGLAKAFTDKKGPLAVDGKTRMTSYVWGRNLGEIVLFLGYKGPMVIGVTWYESMFRADPVTGVIRVDPNSGVAGGHCTFLYGVNIEERLLLGQNSWGTEWAKQGRFAVMFDDFPTLLKGGEFCAGLENPL